jgi:hypothetical protein
MAADVQYPAARVEAAAPWPAAVTLAAALCALALSLPHLSLIVRHATRLDDINVLWPLMPMLDSGSPGVEHVYLLLGVLALLAGVLLLRGSSLRSVTRGLATAAIIVAVVPLGVALVRALYILVFLYRLTPP